MTVSLFPFSIVLWIMLIRGFYYMGIPLFPVGDKTSRIFCNNCGEGLRIETVRNYYASVAKTPFYFYSAFILIGLIILGVFAFTYYKETQTAKYLAIPQMGDIYSVKSKHIEFTVYSFFRVSRIKADSVFMYPNNLDYLMETDKFVETDFFRMDKESGFAQNDLKAMLDRSDIISIERNYDQDKGFQRIK